MNIPLTRPAARHAAARMSFALLACGPLWLCCFSPAEAGLNVWTTRGPLEGPILALAIDSTGAVYAVAGFAGLFKTVDGGESWAATNGGLQGGYLDDVAVDPVTPSVVYVAAYQAASGVFRSADAGATWSPIGPDLPPGVNVLAVDPVAPSTLYAAVIFRPYLTKTEDGGATWVTIGTFPDNVTDVAINPVTPSTVYAGSFRGTPTGGLLSRSLDGGQTWNGITTRLFDPGTGRRYDVMRVVIDPVDPAVVYITTSGGGFKSIDGGDNWTPTERPVTAIDPVVTTTVYSGTRGMGVFRSIDAGATWAPLNSGLTNLFVDDVAVDPRAPAIVYAATDSGVFAIRQTEDTAPPEAAIEAPPSGATVSGTTNVTAIATDDVAVLGVRFLLDGAALGPEDTAFPFEVPWDTRAVPDGTHDLAARARDAAGRSTLSQTVTVTVANGPVPTRAQRRFEEDAATLAPAGFWSLAADEDFQMVFSGGQVAYAEASGAMASFTFKGTGVRWLGFPCELCGIADVLVDGGRVATVDTYAPDRPDVPQVLYTAPRLDMRTHTLTIVVTGTSNAASGGTMVVVDAVEALKDGAGQAPAHGRKP
jgi:photosystem II stability/assembly factor-like uncharacterized protein